jgi:ABC-type polysaccharide/polyol phosphate transport system ATPase subunit
MSRDTVISVRGVTKTFPIHAGQQLLSQRVLRAFRPPLMQDFKALDSVSFEVGRGESVALVGNNGAGKSTLLSLVAGLALPSSGAIEVRGRVGPLLQLGAGFHHDLTGLENIRLNASLMGLSRGATHRLFDDIAAFAEIDEFLREPIRTYSTGMLMRLAFSVAIHLDPEVLIVDEVLGVGDARFQQKCFDRFLRFREEGHTILAVSHSADMLMKLCDRGLWLDHGQLRLDAGISDVIHAYAQTLLPAST